MSRMFCFIWISWCSTLWGLPKSHTACQWGSAGQVNNSFWPCRQYRHVLVILKFKLGWYKQLEEQSQEHHDFPQAFDTICTNEVTEGILRDAARFTVTEVTAKRLGKGHTLAIPREPTTTSKLRTNLDAARRKFEAKRVEKLKQDARSAAVTSRHGKHSASSSGGKTKKTAVDICSIYLKGAMYPLEKAPAEVRFFLNLIYN